MTPREWIEDDAALDDGRPPRETPDDDWLRDAAIEEQLLRGLENDE